MSADDIEAAVAKGVAAGVKKALDERTGCRLCTDDEGEAEEYHANRRFVTTVRKAFEQTASRLLQAALMALLIFAVIMLVAPIKLLELSK